ncbi:MAG: hypothetical protein ISR37_03225 [Balneolaceae bacterium]|jgi:hypothetical protein|nr:hypothetical protein [Balneolaceae bacterium]MBL6916605.1 hypothetical protein [Balneolaceae bacterium]
MTFKLLLFFFLIWVFFRFVGRIFLPLAIFRKAVKNAQNQQPFSNNPFSGTGGRGGRKKDFSAIQDAEFEDLSESEPAAKDKDGAKEASTGTSDNT